MTVGHPTLEPNVPIPQPGCETIALAHFASAPPHAKKNHLLTSWSQRDVFWLDVSAEPQNLHRFQHGCQETRHHQRQKENNAGEAKPPRHTMVGRFMDCSNGMLEN